MPTCNKTLYICHIVQEENLAVVSPFTLHNQKLRPGKKPIHQKNNSCHHQAFLSSAANQCKSDGLQILAGGSSQAEGC